MKHWFREITLPEHDVLVVRGCNEEDGEFIEATARIGELTAAMKMGFEDDVEKADKAFNSYNVGNAENFVKSIKEAMTDGEGE